MDHLNITLTFVCKKVGINEERGNQCHKSTFCISTVKSVYFSGLQNYTEVFPEHIEKKIAQPYLPSQHTVLDKVVYLYLLVIRPSHQLVITKSPFPTLCS